VLEFGLRRAQGIDGGLAASRAAFIGGCAATSNVLAGTLFDIPVKGTHAHSWVMAFPDERQAFQAYAAAQPHNCILLVDTYQTLTGVRHAIEVAGQLRQRGQRLLGIRLDSGDLAALSRQARTLLDEAGLPDVAIVASGDLDEQEIARLRRRGRTSTSGASARGWSRRTTSQRSAASTNWPCCGMTRDSGTIKSNCPKTARRCPTRACCRCGGGGLTTDVRWQT